MKDLHLDSFNMTDRSSVSVNLTKLNIQQMINAAVQQAITAALQAQKIMTSQSSESQSQSLFIKNNDHILVSVWKIEDLDYFQSNLADKNDAHMIMIENQTHY